MSRKCLILFISLLFFITSQIFAQNSLEWHKRNDHLIPNEKETEAILLLNQERDFKSSDIDGDGVENALDPSPYDWREVGYNPFGVLEFLSWNHDWNNYKYDRRGLERIVKLIKEVGITFVRFDFLWEDIEPHEGSYNFEKYDYIVELLTKNQIRILGLLSYSASWAGNDWNYPPYKNETFLNYLSMVVSRYKDKIKYWEIWNEPDSRTYWQPQDDMKTYTRLLKLSYIAAKKIDPSSKIVLGGMTNQGYFAIKNIYKNGGREYFDIINIHPFVNPFHKNYLKIIHNLYNNLEKLKIKYKDENKKIWFTEIGCPGIKYKKDSQGWWEGVFVSEKQQAKFLYSIYTEILRLPNAEKIFWAYFRDNKEHFRNDVDYFGLIRWDFSKKPVFKVYKKISTRWLKANGHKR